MNYFDQGAKQLDLYGDAEIRVDFGTSAVDGKLDGFVGVDDADESNPIFFSGGISLRNGEVSGNTFDFEYSGELSSGANIVALEGTNGSGQIRGDGGSGIVGDLRVGSGFDGAATFNGNGISQGNISIVAICQTTGCS
ncbi:hypothetical protein [Loktanella sp. Alg231-35]|uniref:hypothetical protein n=1 Tax=Loktanella sp. Alg231-35 TaxID=1922220 RepID=UPI00131F1B08|nr:hypothetical protein [Loktanella sp. Alg231-35]